MPAGLNISVLTNIFLTNLTHKGTDVTDGNSMLLSRYSNTDKSNLLYYLQDSENFPDAVIIASEPLDDTPDWQPVPHNTFVCVDENRSMQIMPINARG